MLALVAALEPPRILAARLEGADKGAVLRVLATAPLEGVAIERVDSVLVVSFEAELTEGLEVPAPAGPVEEIRIDSEPPRVRIHLRVGAGIPQDVRTDGSVLVVTIGEAQARSDVEALYGLLFPESPAEPAPPPSEEPAAAEDDWRLGLFFRPAVYFRFVDATSTFLDTAQPTPVRYFEVEPRVGDMGANLTNGRFYVRYQPRIRATQDDVPILDKVSHYVDVGLRTPISLTQVSANVQYIHGTVEAYEIDRGAEYFFGLEPYDKWRYDLAVYTETGSRLELSAAAYKEDVTVGPDSAFFGYDRESLSVGPRYELSPETTATLAYTYERVPRPPDRPEAESRAHIASLRLERRTDAMLNGYVNVGYGWKDYPNGPEGATSYTGWLFGAGVERTFANGWRLNLNGSRDALPSAFEQNPYYLSEWVGLNLYVPLPLSVSLIGDFGYRWNNYPTDALGATEPRKDEVYGGGLSLYRNVTRWASLRVSYRRDWRDSNLGAFRTETHAFVAELGIGFVGGQPR